MKENNKKKYITNQIFSFFGLRGKKKLPYGNKN